ncbi:MAG: biopolymer transporter ExbD, partial [Bacteriovoracia bacterium]
DITSLLDILVILLVFLLRSYNSSGVVLNVPKGIALPQSRSQSPSTTGIIVQVSPTHIYVDDEVVLDSSALPNKVYDHKGKRIIPLYDTLVKKRNEIEAVTKRSLKAQKFSGIVNLVVDKTLKYNYLRKLMYTCAEAGFQKYKFVVLGEET